MNKTQTFKQAKAFPRSGSEVMVLLLVVSLGGSDGDAAIVLELDDLLGREVVKEGVGFIEVLVGGLGGPQLPLQLLDPLEPLS